MYSFSDTVHYLVRKTAKFHEHWSTWDRDTYFERLVLPIARPSVASLEELAFKTLTKWISTSLIVTYPWPKFQHLIRNHILQLPTVVLRHHITPILKAYDNHLDSAFLYWPISLPLHSEHF